MKTFYGFVKFCFQIGLALGFCIINMDCLSFFREIKIDEAGQTENSDLRILTILNL